MIAPANYLENSRLSLATASSPVDDELLPWADPYIAQLMYQHELELAELEERRRPAVRSRLAALQRGGLLAVA